jgi:hypothetical protein
MTISTASVGVFERLIFKNVCRPYRRERSSPVKNRKRENCTSGSVRDEDGNILIYSATHRMSMHVILFERDRLAL